MNFDLRMGAFCVVFLMTTPALAAVTIINQDSRPHTVTINRGTSETRQDIVGGKSVQIECPTDCGFHDEASGFSRLAGGESKLVIDKDAELHFLGGRGDLIMNNGTD